MIISRKAAIIIFGCLLVLVTIIFSLFKTNGSPSEQSKIEFSVLLFKVDGKDKTEDTRQIQQAIDYVSKKGGGRVTFPKGVYYIDALSSINLRNNITLNFEEGVILKALPNNGDSYKIINISNVKNVKLLGEVTIIGDRKLHMGETGEWGHGIVITGAENIRIENAIIKDCWGDGIYIGSTKEQNFSKNIVITSPVLINNRRQGISIISAINLEITDPVISKTRGTAPESGIDLEPNNPSEFLQKIKIINPQTEKNEGYGILFFLENLRNSKNKVDISIENTDNIKDKFGIFMPETIKGKVIIGEEYVLNK